MSEVELVSYVVDLESDITLIPGASDKRIITAKFYILNNPLSGYFKSLVLKNLRMHICDGIEYFYEDIYKKAHTGSDDLEKQIGIARKPVAVPATSKRPAKARTPEESRQNYFRSGKPVEFLLILNHNEAM